MADKKKKEECLICGERLEYLEQAMEQKCEICGSSYLSNARCVSGHFVCDRCHGKAAWHFIVESCLKSKETDALVIANNLMTLPAVHMHGPEHHLLTGAALLTAFHNCNYGDAHWNLKMALQEARIRAEAVPGGVCGFWGCCGAAISAGIFASIISKATPLSIESRGQINLLTSKILEQISKVGGPRCCKRETYTAIKETIEFAKILWNLNLGNPEQIRCSFFGNNKQCLGTCCKFHP